MCVVACFDSCQMTSVTRKRNLVKTHYYFSFVTKGVTSRGYGYASKTCCILLQFWAFQPVLSLYAGLSQWHIVGKHILLGNISRLQKEWNAITCTKSFNSTIISGWDRGTQTFHCMHPVFDKVLETNIPRSYLRTWLFTPLELSNMVSIKVIMSHDCWHRWTHPVRGSGRYKSGLVQECTERIPRESVTISTTLQGRRPAARVTPWLLALHFPWLFGKYAFCDS